MSKDKLIKKPGIKGAVMLDPKSIRAKFLYGEPPAEDAAKIKDMVRLYMESIVKGALGTYTEVGKKLTHNAACYFDLYARNKSWPHWLQLMGMSVSNSYETRRHGHDL